MPPKPPTTTPPTTSHPTFCRSSTPPKFFFFKYPPPTEISPLPLPAALPISALPPRGAPRHAGLVPLLPARRAPRLRGLAIRDAGAGHEPGGAVHGAPRVQADRGGAAAGGDRKSTRLNSSH